MGYSVFLWKMSSFGTKALKNYIFKKNYDNTSNDSIKENTRFNQLY